MVMKKESIEWFLFGEPRDPLYLIKTDGKSLPYRDCCIPEIFRKPLIISATGEVKGWKSKAFKSGGRSALVYHEGKWYDLEGVRPSEKEYMPRVPVGGNSLVEAKNELNVGSLFFDYAEENKVQALMKPVCLFEYSKIQFEGEPVYASVLETKGDLRLSHFFGDYSIAAQKAYNRLKKDRSRDVKIDRITNKIKDKLTNKIGQWTGFWYRCLEKNNLIWGTRYAEDPYGTYAVNSNSGNNNLAAYRLNDNVAVSIIDLDSCQYSDKKIKDLELDRIKKRLSIWEVTLHLLKYGKSAVNISQYHVSQTYASRIYTKIKPPKGINYFQETLGYDPLQELEIPKMDKLGIIKSFNDGRQGVKPEPIQERYITNVKEMFLT